MEIIQSLFSLFFNIVNQIISVSVLLPFLYLLSACFVFALVFNIVHMLMGGD